LTPRIEFSFALAQELSKHLFRLQSKWNALSTQQQELLQGYLARRLLETYKIITSIDTIDTMNLNLDEEKEMFS